MQQSDLLYVIICPGKIIYTLCMVPRETVSFIFPQVLMFPLASPDYFPEGPYIKCFIIYLDFPFNNYNKTNKQKTERVTTTELYLIRGTGPRINQSQCSFCWVKG